MGKCHHPWIFFWWAFGVLPSGLQEGEGRPTPPTHISHTHHPNARSPRPSQTCDLMTSSNKEQVLCMCEQHELDETQRNATKLFRRPTNSSCIKNLRKEGCHKLPTQGTKESCSNKFRDKLYPIIKIELFSYVPVFAF